MIIEKLPMKSDSSFIKNMSDVNSLSDLYALSLLQSLIIGFPMLHFSYYSMRPFHLFNIVSDILTNKRKSIIEFGAGVSTIILGRLIRQNNLNVQFVSIEHDRVWAKNIKSVLINEKIDHLVKIVHAPLIECPLSIEKAKWYDLEILNCFISDKKFDLVINDGPTDLDNEISVSNYPLMPFINDKLDNNFSVYHTASRRIEKKMIEHWEALYSFKFTMLGTTLAYTGAGKGNDSQRHIFE